MRNATRLMGIAALVAASVSCGDVVRQGSSPMFLVIDSLKQPGAANPGPLLSHVATSTSDDGEVVLSTTLKDFSLAPTSNNDVTISRYHVEYTRADGRNTPGVDVPYAFDGAVTISIPAGTSRTFNITLVQNVAKQQAPLVSLRTNSNTITTFANVTFYGADRVGNAISVTGPTQIDFRN